ncbi:VOC family protein [Spiribacter halobius]|uniref:Glyoxalase n=1 Tax=Sediminicurvatus halobius TaxID=2182432 RepID=A0A2U2N3G0_9GAMM|nr:VOC family protein [Spiribacter halobius]PWG63509.1 glyoxalase [Spiribacter halobius]UEX79621.1 VOC family protein [Spiribacter halobius]
MSEGQADRVGGIHHVTAIAGDPARNVAFYTGVLGLRLVKRTVNFDDPGTWHLYYGDGAGSPGTILTFFPYPGLPAGRHGTGQAVEVAFSVPEAAFAFWLDRLVRERVDFDGPEERLGQKLVRFRDPDGLQLELVADPQAPDAAGWDGMPVAPAHAVRGFHSVTLWQQGYERTARVLEEALGYRAAAEEGSRFRFTARGDAAPGRLVDLRCLPDFWRGGPGAGTVHHIAFRAADDAAQAAVRERLVAAGVDVTPVLDRRYFRSIYFREPGGVLFEVATDPPGFAVDEPPERLGTELQLPPWLEPRWQAIAGRLPPLERGAGEADEVFDYRFLPARPEGPGFALVLLHGTGGDEHSLVPIGEAVAPGAALLSPRGQVLEQGQPRFFRRFAEGVLDADDLRRRAGELAAFVTRAAVRHGLGETPRIALGYSNGANIAAATLLLHPAAFAGAVLLRPMQLPLGQDEAGRLAGQPLLILAGRRDAIVPAGHPEALRDFLVRAGAEVELRWLPGGHGLAEEELAIVADWLRALS